MILSIRLYSQSIIIAFGTYRWSDNYERERSGARHAMANARVESFVPRVARQKVVILCGRADIPTLAWSSEILGG